jgi:hypothetical protein
LPADVDVGAYYALNDAILEHFFNPSCAGRSVTLALDDGEAAVIEAEMGLDTGQLAEHLFAAVGGLAVARSGNPHRFIWWWDREIRECVALLAASVLIMSRQGVTREGTIDQHGFYRNYNELVLARRSLETPRGFDLQRHLWWRLERYLNEGLNGALGRIVFLSVLRYPHLNFPASQCLVRAGDRRKLREAFQRYCDPKVDIKKGELNRLVQLIESGLSRGFTRAVGLLSTDGDLADGFWKVIMDEYAAWQRSPAAITVRGSRGGSSIRRGVTTGIAERRLVDANPPRPNTGPTDDDQIVATEPLRPIRRTYASSRLVLRAEAYDRIGLALEGDVHSAADAEPRHWSLVEGSLSGDEFREGCRREAAGCVFAVVPHEQAFFAKLGLLWVELLRTPSEPTKMRMLCIEESADEIVARLERNGSHAVRIAMAGALAGVCGFEFHYIPIVPDISIVPDIPIVLDIPIVPARGAISKPGVAEGAFWSFDFVSGLRLRGGRFVEGGQPLVVLRDPGVGEAEVALDDKVVGRLSYGEPFALPDCACAVGSHVVEVLSQQRKFIIAPADDEDVPAATSSLGYVLSRYPATMRTDVGAEDQKIDELAVKNAAVLVGCDLLLPYRRARP